MKWLIALVLVALGFYTITHNFAIVRLFGRPTWAEKYLGAGGSYNFWILFGIGCILVAFLVLAYSSFFGL